MPSSISACIDPEKAVIQVEEFETATSQFAQTTLRSVVGQHDLDEMLAEREKLNAEVQRILDERTDAWGIKVSNVELKHIDLNETMIRAIAKQAEAERLRRAKIIDAEGELQAAERLAQAGEILSKRPEAMQLRYLGTLLNIAGEKSTTIVFPCLWTSQVRSGVPTRRTEPQRGSRLPRCVRRERFLSLSFGPPGACASQDRRSLNKARLHRMWIDVTEFGGTTMQLA